jgi:hypothetical protein
MSAGDTKALIEQAVTRLLDEVPALKPLKIVIGLELQGRGDTQLYRVQLHGADGLQVTKDMAADSKIRVYIHRTQFNPLAIEGHVKQWHQAFDLGHVKAEGPGEILKLIANVVAKQEERARLRKASH